MALLSQLFGKKQKPPRAYCAITKEPIEPGFGFLLTTEQVISSKRYWDLVMTEPETLSYTRQHFQNEAVGTQMRTLIFEKYACTSKPWLISDSVIDFFNVDKAEARDRARAWWASSSSDRPEAPGQHFQQSDTFVAMRQYAIYEAGRSRISVAP